MRFLAIALLIFVASCSFKLFDYSNGNFKEGEHSYNLTGGILIDLYNNDNLVVMHGMINGRHDRDFRFELESKIIKHYKYSDGSFFIEAEYIGGKTGILFAHSFHGFCQIIGNAEFMIYTGTGIEDYFEKEFTIYASGFTKPCPFYSMKEAATRAGYLVGARGYIYTSIIVFNYAIFGFSNLRSVNSSYYNDTFGEITNTISPGVLIFGLRNSLQIAIVDKEGDKFIFSPGVGTYVIAIPISRIHIYFDRGYILKKYDCPQIKQF